MSARKEPDARAEQESNSVQYFGILDTRSGRPVHIRYSDYSHNPPELTSDASYPHFRVENAVTAALAIEHEPSIDLNASESRPMHGDFRGRSADLIPAKIMILELTLRKPDGKAHGFSSTTTVFAVPSPLPKLLTTMLMGSKGTMFDLSKADAKDFGFPDAKRAYTITLEEVERLKPLVGQHVRFPQRESEAFELFGIVKFRNFHAMVLGEPQFVSLLAAKPDADEEPSAPAP